MKQDIADFGPELPRKRPDPNKPLPTWEEAQKASKRRVKRQNGACADIGWDGNKDDGLEKAPELDSDGRHICPICGRHFRTGLKHLPYCSDDCERTARYMSIF